MEDEEEEVEVVIKEEEEEVEEGEVQEEKEVEEEEVEVTLEEGEWSAARPGRTLSPGKTRYPLYRRRGGLQGRSGLVENLVSIGIGFRTFQPVVSCYTD